MAKVHILNGDPHAMITGSQAVAHKVIIVQNIIQGDSQEDVRFAVLPDIHRTVYSSSEAQGQECRVG